MPPEILYQHGFIRKYIIKYRKVNCSALHALTNSTPLTTRVTTTVKSTLTTITQPSTERSYTTIEKEIIPTTKPSQGDQSHSDEDPPSMNSLMRQTQQSALSSIQSESMTWNSTEVGYTYQNATLKGLDIWSCYRVKVITVTVGPSPDSNVVTRRTDESGEFLCVILFLPREGTPVCMPWY